MNDHIPSKSLSDRILAQLGKSIEERLNATALRLSADKKGNPTIHADLPNLNMGALIRNLPGQSAGRDMEHLLSEVLAGVDLTYYPTPRAKRQDLIGGDETLAPLEVKFARGTLNDPSILVFAGLRLEGPEKVFALASLDPNVKVYNGRTLVQALRFTLVYGSELKMVSGKDDLITSLTLNTGSTRMQKYQMLLEEKRTGNIQWLLGNIARFVQH